jgi:hypothetical protein
VTFEEGHEILKDYWLALSVAGFFLGFLVHARLELGKERRKEYNEVANEIRALLIRSRSHPWAFPDLPTDEQLDLLYHYLWPLHRWRIARALRELRDCGQREQRQGPAGDITYADQDAIQARLQRLIDLIARK